jgi:hypothetical protein
VTLYGLFNPAFREMDRHPATQEAAPQAAGN